MIVKKAAWSLADEEEYQERKYEFMKKMALRSNKEFDQFFAEYINQYLVKGNEGQDGIEAN